MVSPKSAARPAPARLPPPVARAGEPAQRLGRETLADRLAARLWTQIEQGEIASGDRLPTEARLADTHGVSRSVVREAVHRLKSRGVLVSRQGSGVFVLQPPMHRALEFDPAVLDSMTAVGHVLEVRRTLEGEMAALAALRATRAQVTALRRALAAIDEAASAGHDGVAEDLAFHRRIGEATGNPQFSLLLGFLEQYLRENMKITRANEARREDFMEQVRKEHRSIVDAIAAHDVAGARRAAIRHLQHGERRLELGGLWPPPLPAAAARRTRSSPRSPA
ncbi:MAG: FadR family transcriptional regulator [Ideonella sp.]|nr:FadR family transcriptional regulator [Ideonella sp.]